MPVGLIDSAGKLRDPKVGGSSGRLLPDSNPPLAIPS